MVGCKSCGGTMVEEETVYERPGLRLAGVRIWRCACGRIDIDVEALKSALVRAKKAQVLESGVRVAVKKPKAG